METQTVARQCANDSKVREIMCSCEHVREDHIPADYSPNEACGVDGCACKRFQRMTAFGWTVRATGPL
jgi:hypothetical protein